MEEDIVATGWDAIDRRLEPLYSDQEPVHYGTILSASLGGPDPLDGISAYKREDSCSHWHVITYGFSELYDKETDEPETSDYGFELTFRLSCDPNDAEPPPWCLNFLQNLARYVFRTGNVFSAGDHMDLNGPIALGADTAIVAVGFVNDPELEPIESPNGRAGFVQVVGLTEDEFLAVKRWNTIGFFEVMSRSNPLLITDIGRESILRDKEVEAVVAFASAKEGSSTASLFNDGTSWVSLRDGIVVTIGANPAGEASLLMLGRLLHGRDLALVAEEYRVTFSSGEQGTYQTKDARNELKITLTRRQIHELSRGLGRGVGTFKLDGLDGVHFEVVVSKIKDLFGNVVDEVR